MTAVDRFHDDKMSGSRAKTNFPPDFWDNLSLVPLTVRALRELDRRQKILRPRLNSASLQPRLTDLGRFARGGGPDIRRLRGV